MRELIAEVRSHLRKRRDLERMKDELFIRAVEYARLVSTGAVLEDGSWHLYCKTDGDNLAEHKLKELGVYSLRILREMSIVPLERAALLRKEQMQDFGTLLSWWKTHVRRSS
jgi:hypothetical protein